MCNQQNIDVEPSVYLNGFIDTPRLNLSNVVDNVKDIKDYIIVKRTTKRYTPPPWNFDGRVIK